MYGQTEATARISCFDLAAHPSKIGSVGLLLDNLKAVNKSSIDNPTEILLTGPSVTSGYLTSWYAYDGLLNANTTLHTGDIGYFDLDNFLYITGRSSRFAKIAGIRLNLDLLEQQLSDQLSLSIYLVSDDSKIFIFSIGNELASKPKITGVHPTQIRTIRLNDLPIKSNGKINYQTLLRIALDY